MNPLAVPRSAIGRPPDRRPFQTILPSNDDVAGSLPRSYLRPCLLLLLEEGPSHGYELLEQVRRIGMRSAEPGGLYRALRSMEREKLVSSWWEPSQSGPARRTYLLTATGREAVTASAEALREMQRLVTRLLNRYEAVGEHNGRRSRHADCTCGQGWRREDNHLGDAGPAAEP